MRFIHCLTNLTENNNCFIDRHRSPCLQSFGECVALEVFHHQVSHGLVACADDAEISHVDDVWMSKRSDRLCLSSEPFDEFTIAGKFRRNDFDGYSTASAHVRRAIDCA